MLHEFFCANGDCRFAFAFYIVRQLSWHSSLLSQCERLWTRGQISSGIIQFFLADDSDIWTARFAIAVAVVQIAFKTAMITSTLPYYVTSSMNHILYTEWRFGYRWYTISVSTECTAAFLYIRYTRFLFISKSVILLSRWVEWLSPSGETSFRISFPCLKVSILLPY